MPNSHTHTYITLTQNTHTTHTHTHKHTRLQTDYKLSALFLHLATPKKIFDSSKK